MASANIEVVKGPNENNLSVLRRFTKRVQGSGILPRIRSKRYSERSISKQVKKAKTLAYIRKKGVIAELIKLGKTSELNKLLGK